MQRSKLSQQDIVALYLASWKGEWVPSHYLIKQNTAFGYLGTRGIMRGKECAYTGFHIVGHNKYYIERDNKHGKYALFRCTKVEDLTVKAELQERAGEMVCTLSKGNATLFV